MSRHLARNPARARHVLWRGAALVLPAGTVALLIASGGGCGGDSGSGPGEEPFSPDTLDVSAPFFPPMAVPAGNPVTAQGVALGRRLFYDPVLSGDNTQSCSDCHAQEFGFSDHGRRFSEGIDGGEGGRNAPALTNVGWADSLFLDGRAPSLELQALEPVQNPIEMHETWENAVAEIRANPAYPPLFAAAFGDPAVTRERVTMAIAQFERTFISNGSKLDRFMREEISELSPAEQRGRIVFFNDPGPVTRGAHCFHCHPQPLFTDLRYHDIGLVADGNPGRAVVTGKPEDQGKYRTPTLRNVAFSAPYMHDGRFSTLMEVIEHYDHSVIARSTTNPLLLVAPNLTTEEKEDLLAFLLTMTDSSFVQDPDFASPETGRSGPFE